MGVAKGKKKEAKNPVDDFIRSMYWLTPMPEDGTMESFEEAIANGARFGFRFLYEKRDAGAFAEGFAWVRFGSDGGGLGLVLADPFDGDDCL